MIPLEAYLHAVTHVLERDLNDPQVDCVSHAADQDLMIIAGPGSGKTTVLVLRALRHVLVDGMAPESVLITTFTRKGAAEIASRLVGWGLTLIEHFSAQARRAGNAALATWLSNLDVSGIRAGTFDSFCQEWLGQTRQVGTPTPVMLEQFAADFVFRRQVFSRKYRAGANQAILDPYLAAFSADGQVPRSQGQAGDLSMGINHRLMQDLVDVGAYAQTSAAANLQAELLADFRAHLQGQQMFDFSLCAHQILNGLRQGWLYARLPPTSALLVDEYQDTNPLQEAIYFELVKQSQCAFAVVGDDDQALYRFRGATVELFTNFPERYAGQIAGATSVSEYLVTNHRSTPEIVAFVNRFASHDADFVSARVRDKPEIERFNPSRGVPVLGMFRDSIDDLGADLTRLLVDVFKGPGRVLPRTGVNLRVSGQGGALGDAVLLASSSREYKPGKDGPVKCLPIKLRHGLEEHGLGVFNPRGQDLRDLPSVRRLLGLVLLCLDPTDAIEADLPITRDTRAYLPQWRAAADAFIRSDPEPKTRRNNLATFVRGWRERRASDGGGWPNEVPLLDLLYKLIVWMPEFQRDPEHQVYLEAIMRCVVQGAHYSAYSFAILNVAPHDLRSRMSVIRDLMEPVAEKVIDIDEDLLFAVPRNRLGIMTIHQSKGLEYPLVIVDVGSEFSRNHHLQAFKRFPSRPSSTALMEAAFAPQTGIGPLRMARTDLDRTFDDLMRLYYVAYSRAQVALLLVGLTKSIEYATNVQNVATFWRRDGAWSWRRDNPPLKRNTPTRPELSQLELL